MGGFGSDTYLFGRGDGQDAINNDSDAYNGYADPDITKRDVLQFKAGILVGDVALSRSGDALIVKINGTTDQVTISNYFIGDGVSTRTWAVEQIKFNDGTIWDVATVKAMMLSSATVGNDTIIGYATNDTINGLAGNDTMYGRDGDDALNGGADSDILYGEAGNDNLNAGTGTNTLTGGAGKDVFEFTTTGHIDTITDYNVVDDTIQLENTVFSALTTAGTLAADQFVIGTHALDTNDFIIYNNVTGALLYDADGSGVSVATQIAMIGTGLSMTNMDLVVI